MKQILSWFTFQEQMRDFERMYVPKMNVRQQNHVNCCLWDYWRQGIDVNVGETIKVFYPRINCLSVMYMSEIVEGELGFVIE